MKERSDAWFSDDRIADLALATTTFVLTRRDKEKMRGPLCQFWMDLRARFPPDSPYCGVFSIFGNEPRASPAVSCPI